MQVVSSANQRGIWTRQIGGSFFVFGNALLRGLMTDASVVTCPAIVEVETRATCMSRVAGYQLKMIIAAWLRLTLYSIEHVIG
jgi:hypothetical protein